MCASCFTNADFLVTGGILSAASLRVGVRTLLPGAATRWAKRVTDEEAAEFVDSLQPDDTASSADSDPRQVLAER